MHSSEGETVAMLPSQPLAPAATRHAWLVLVLVLVLVLLLVV
jgi:hypothetical protein